MNLYAILAGQGTTHFERLFSQKFAGGGKTHTMTGAPPLSFRANGTPLISWSMKGNGSQTGTPTPDAPIEPGFVGELDGADWTIPISCAGRTTSISLGQTNTIRKIKKRVFNGTEGWIQWDYMSATMFYVPVTDGAETTVYSTHFINGSGGIPSRGCVVYNGSSNKNMVFRMLQDGGTVDSFKSWLASQYAAGTPVTVWYILAEPTTGLVNEPLAKIGDCVDELHSADAGVSIPTAKGTNVLTIGTDLQPSEMTITFKG